MLMNLVSPCVKFPFVYQPWHGRKKQGDEYSFPHSTSATHPSQRNDKPETPINATRNHWITASHRQSKVNYLLVMYSKYTKVHLKMEPIQSAKQAAKTMSSITWEKTILFKHDIHYERLNCYIVIICFRFLLQQWERASFSSRMYSNNHCALSPLQGMLVQRQTGLPEASQPLKPRSKTRMFFISSFSTPVR